MSYPSVVISVSEAGAPVPPSSAQIPNCIGACSLGVTGQGYSFGSIPLMKAGLGHGHLVDVMQVLMEAGLKTALATPADETSVAGTTSAVTHVGTGDPMVVAGTPLHDLEVTVEVLSTGTTANGLATIRYAVDGYPDVDPTFTSPIVVTADPISLADTAMTIDWPDTAGPAAADLVAGDTYKFSTRPAHYNSGGAPTAMQLQSLITRAATFLLYTGTGTDVASAADTLAVAVGTLINSLAVTSARFLFALVPAGRDSAADTITAFADTVVAPLPFVTPGYGGAPIALTNPIAGRGWVRLQAHEWIAWTLLKRTFSGAPQRTRAGALPARSLDFDGSIEGSGVHDARVATLKSEGTRGFFLGGAPLLHAPGSKINQVQHASVLCQMMDITYGVLFKWRSEGCRANIDGTLDPRDVEAVTEELFNALKDGVLVPENDRGVQGHVSSIRVEVSKTAILPKLSAKTYTKLLGYPEEITGEIVVI